MITKEDLDKAISECIRTQSPTANTCMKLAAFYIIHDHMMEVSGDSEFMAAVRKTDIKHVLAVMDDLMHDLQAVNPRMYENAIKRLINGG